MPRYNYECGLCGVTESYRLAMDQKPEACVSCDISGSLSRIFRGNTFILPKNTKAAENNQPAGVLTKEYIEENRKILEQQKSEFGREEYEQT